MDLETDSRAPIEPDHGQKSVRGGTVMVLSHALQFVLGVSSAMILARILTPGDFGVFAMSAVTLALARSLGDFGVPMAVVHEARPDPASLDRLFWLNLVLNGVLALLLCALAPAVAAFFDEPGLLPITFALAIAVLVEGATSVQLGLLRRRLSFAAVAWMEIGAQVVGVAVAVTVAVLGGGYWALVLQQVAAALVQAVVRWFACGWRPGRPRRSGGESLASLVRFGKFATYTRVLGALSREIDRVLLGRLLGAGPLGLYHNAQRWAIFPVRQLHVPLLGVAVASFSRLQDEPERYERYVRTALLGFFTAVLPALALLFLEAHDVVPLLLGPQWDEAIPLFRIFALGAASFGAMRVLKWIYLSEGRTRDQFRWSLVATPVTIAALVAGTAWGAAGVAVGYTVGTTLLVVPAVAYCLRGSPLPGDVVWSAAWRPAVASAAAGSLLAILGVLQVGPELALERFALAALIFTVLYLGCWVALPGGRRSGLELLAALRRIRGGT